MKRRAGLVCLLLLNFSIATDSQAKSLVCIAPNIAGYEYTNKIAKGIIGYDSTTDKSQIRIYIEKNKDGFYFQSNFCKQDCSKVSPTKILIDESITLKQALENIIYTKDNKLSSDEWDAEAEILLNTSVKIYLDKSVFDTQGRPLLDVSGADNIDIVSATEKITLASSVSRLDLDRPPPLLVKRLTGCCLDGFPALAAAKILVELRSAPIAKNQIRLASLVQDTATEAVIRNSKGLSKIAVPRSGVKDSASLKKSIEASNGKTLIILGHVENEKFVMRNAKGEIILEADFDELHELANSNNVNLIHLGCNTADQIAKETTGVGVAVKFNTVEVAKRLNDALKNSTTFDELLTNLSSEGLRIVVSEHFTARLKVQGYKADVYAKQNDDDFWVKIAQFFYFKS